MTAVMLYRQASDSRTDRRVSIDGHAPDHLYFQDDPVPYRMIRRLGVEEANYSSRPMTFADAERLAPLLTAAIVNGEHPDYYLKNLTSAEIVPLVLYMLTHQDQLLGVPL